ncbi:MAG: outer membrane beta-barrel protein [Steroidobacteraceae bacterium]
MRRSALIPLAALLAIGPLAAAQAEGISYTYADLGYVTTDLDAVSKDLDGFLLRGSLEIANNWFLYARYVDQSVSFSNVDVDVEEYGVGGGYAWSFAENMDLYGRVGYVSAQADASGGGFGGYEVDDDGYEVGIGIRARPLDPLELEGSVTYVDLSDAGDDTAFGVAARWFITENVALAVEGAFADDADSYGVGFRWAFGK